ncbi:MAG: hypothetical protein NTX03_08515, partial [Bacteroidetes bacterium]|nr:hypothetical protein [Bacteroidota bacterium]
YNLFVDISCVGKMFYFFDTRTNQCILISNNQFVIYPQESKLILFFLNSKISNASRQIKKRVKLIQPELVKYANSNPEKIYIEQFNIFEPWVAATPDIIKVSNVLNRDYFSDDMIKRAISVMKSYLKNDGYLVISDNREIEKVSLYQLKDNRFLKLIEINSGTEISNLVS